MNLPAEWKKVLAVIVVASACAAATAKADDTASPATSSSATALKWTPHRPARVANAPAVTPPAPATTPPATPAPATLAPAAQPTAEAVQPAAPAPPVSEASTAPTAKPITNPVPPAARVASVRPVPIRGILPPATVRPDPPVAGITLPTIKFPPVTSIFARSPQGEASRPMLASGGYQPPRIHGGRSPRLAMNADDLPSVISRNDTQPPPPASGPAAGVAKSPSPPTPAAQPQSAAQPSVRESAASPEMGETIEFAPSMDGMPVEMASPSDGMWMGGYPQAACQDPCIDDCCPEDECGFLPCCQHTGRVCGWLRQFGRPYYGWRWHRDFTASAGVTGFQTPAELGIAGNFGTNEYANFGMPFWNAFGIGWQLGVRGVQTHFHNTSIEGLTDDPFVSGARDQVFVTTGFYTRAFEGRGLQFGAVWDYLRDNWYDNVDLAQIRGEISYVWHAHEVGFWGAANYDTTPFSTRRFSGNASTMDLYAAFYRLQFGDANEWKVWGGGTDNGDGLIGTLLRAPMTKSLALEGTFTYLIPKDTKTYPLGTDDDGDTVSITTADSAWNISVNVVFYPACRSRRGLASPYRPLFDVADNGSMIRSLEAVGTGP